MRQKWEVILNKQERKKLEFIRDHYQFDTLIGALSWMISERYKIAWKGSHGKKIRRRAELRKELENENNES